MLHRFGASEIDGAAALLRAGGVLAYPTEAVFGLGCDPQDLAAFERVCALKQRPMDQGVLLIAADVSQIERYIALDQLPASCLERVQASWPGPTTWVFPRSAAVPAWLVGAHDGIALRVTAHEPAAALCRAFGGAIVSTSANPHGQPPALFSAGGHQLFRRCAGWPADRTAARWRAAEHHPRCADRRYHPSLGRPRGCLGQARDRAVQARWARSRASRHSRRLRPAWSCCATRRLLKARNAGLHGLATVFDTQQNLARETLPLLAGATEGRAVAWRQGEAVSAAQFLADVRHVAEHLPQAPAAVNLCEDRYAFLVAFSAIALRGQANLLPSSRAPRAIDEVMAAHPGCYALGDQLLDPAPPHYQRLPALPAVTDGAVIAWPELDADQVVAIGYTSGSTGQPAAHVKTWRSFHASNAGNLKKK